MRSQKIVPVSVGVICAALSATLPARADTRDEVVSGIERCAVIHDNRLWLDCVYGAVQPMRAQLGLQPVPEFQQRLVPPPQMGTAVAPAAPAYSPPAPAPARTASRPAPRRKVGFWGNLLGLAPPVTVSRMASYSYEPNGAFLVTLANGQRWRQTDEEGGTVVWTKTPASYEVTVSEGAFGSYNLRTSDNPRNYKVQPVK
ncbi:MAG TPA: hypothetical protein VFI23_14380 [Rhizomicrobium sp.]|nr:hypothetical protein [Rhizomicrobium sp.]